MQKPRAGQRQWVMSVLWSGFLALWHDRARRHALPLLLATLLLLFPSLPARSDCSCEFGEHYHQGEHHYQGEHHQMVSHHEGEETDHDESEAHEHSIVQGAAAFANSAALQAGHAHPGAWTQLRTSGAGAACCSCPSAPLSAAFVAAPASPQTSTHSQALIYVRTHALPVYGFHALTGLFGRAGPSAQSKPQLLFLASLAGRAPPVSL